MERTTVSLAVIHQSRLLIQNQFNITRYVDFVCSLGNKVINEPVKFIQETLQFITKDKQRSFLIMYGDLEVQYKLSPLVIPRKCLHYRTFIFYYFENN